MYPPYFYCRCLSPFLFQTIKHQISKQTITCNATYLVRLTLVLSMREVYPANGSKQKGCGEVLVLQAPRLFRVQNSSSVDYERLGCCWELGLEKDDNATDTRGICCYWCGDIHKVALSKSGVATSRACQS